MTTRTDVHSPANLVTEDYEYVYCGDNSPEEGTPGWAFGFNQTVEGRAFLREIHEGLAKSPVSERNIYNCHHCGARIRYFALLRHVPTSAIIAVGETCLENRFERATSDFQKVRKAAQLDREAHRIKTAAAEALADVDPDIHDCLVKAEPTEFVNVYSQKARSHEIVTDIRRRLHTYGEVSVKQINLVGRIILQEQARETKQAAQDAEVKVDAPEGRIQFTGVVVSRKLKATDFGDVWKLTVKVETEAGVWLAWLSEPTALASQTAWSEERQGYVESRGVELGDTITLTATLTRSDKDPAFAFGKRPAKANIVNRAVA